MAGKMKKKLNNNSELILIAEDSPTQSEQLKFILENHNYEVLTAKNGKEALQLAAQNKPSLIISDIVMPEMNGYNLCKEIKSNENTMDIPVILLTSLAKSDDVLEGISCGADNFITKPYNEDYLISRVNQTLANKEIQKTEIVKFAVEIVLGGKKRFITAGQQQMLTLLISTYDAAVQRNDELRQTQDELKIINEHLEEMVSKRTAELSVENTIRQQAEERVNKLNRVYAVLSNINQTIVRVHDTEQLLKNSCLVAVTDGKFQSAWIGLMNNETNKIETIATAGLENNLAEIDSGLNPITKVIHSGKHFISNKINTDNRLDKIWKQKSMSLGFKSFALLPLIVFEKIKGGLIIYSDEFDFFDDQEISLLDEMATDISFALEYIQKEDERKKAEEEITLNERRLKSLVEILQHESNTIQGFLDYALEESIKLTDSKIGYIYHYNEEKEEFVLNTWSKDVMKECKVLEQQTIYQLDKTGLWGEAVRQRKPIMINNFQAPDSLKKGYPEGHAHLSKFLTIPVLKDNQIVGVVGVANKETDYNETDILQLTLLVDNVWKVIDRKKAEKTLRDSEVKERLLLESINEIVYSTKQIAPDSLQGIPDFVSNRSETIIGIKPEEFLRDPNLWFSLIHPDDISEMSGQTVDIFSSKKAGMRKYRLRNRQSGNYIWIEDFVVPELDNENNVIGTFGVARDITDRVNAERTLLESEERFRILFDKAPLGYQSLDYDGNFIDVNQAWLDTLGYTREEVVGKWFGDFLAPKFRDAFRERFPLFKSLGKIHSEFEMISKNGDIRFIAFDGRIGTDLAGNFKQTHCILKDITDTKLVEEALRESEERYRSVTHSANDAIVTADINGVILGWNIGAEKIFGYTEGEIIGRDLTVIIPQSFSEQHKKGMKRVEQGGEHHVIGKTVELIGLHKNGNEFPLELSLAEWETSKGKFYTGIIRDITERKVTEEEIAMLAHSLRSVNECVSITDMKDKILFVNDSFLKTYGYKDYELIGKHMEIVRSPNNPHELVKEILPATLKGGWTGELINKRKDGSEFPIYLSTTKIKNKEGNPIGLIGVGSDITDRKRFEKELIEAKERAEQSDKLKTEFLAQMSHEIRTPLNAIVGNVSFIRETYDEKMDQDSSDCFDGIDVASKRIIRTIDLILNVSELQTSGYEPSFVKIDLHLEILQKLYSENQISAKQKGLWFSYYCTESDTDITVDEYSVIQIFANLIDNAIKYTFKGKVEIQLGRNADNKLMVEIKDTGIGIRKEFLPKLFEPFVQEEQGFTRSYEGNGLGLSLVKKYCEINNAIIEVESEKNVGSTFRVIFNK